MINGPLTLLFTAALHQHCVIAGKSIRPVTHVSPTHKKFNLPDLVLQRANNRSFEKFNYTAKIFF